MTTKTYWAGFVDGEICVEHRLLEASPECSGPPAYRYHLNPYIFMTEKDAKLYFDDVRKVEIREVK